LTNDKNKTTKNGCTKEEMSIGSIRERSNNNDRLGLGLNNNKNVYS